jgi:hypothetical protein
MGENDVSEGMRQNPAPPNEPFTSERVMRRVTRNGEPGNNVVVRLKKISLEKLFLFFNNYIKVQNS